MRTPIRAACGLALLLGCGDRVPDQDGDAPDTDALPDTEVLADACAAEPYGAPLGELVAVGPAIAASANVFFGGAKRVQLDEELAALAPGDPARMEPLIERGFERMKEGATEGAIADLDEALGMALGTALEKRVRELLATAWIRRAELDNCLTSGDAAVCLVPFDPSAVHADPDGMRQAILQFEAILAADPSDIRARWLMNLAHMALGTWPDAIQPELVVPPSVFTSDRDVPAWRNLAPALGLIKPVPSGAAMMEDLDGDSWLDLILGSYDPVEPATVWHNNADGTFCDVTASAGMAWQPGMMGLTQADYDNDGDVDLYLARGAWQGREGAVRGSLLRNDGRGRFDDVTLASGLEAAPGPSQVGMWGDYDRDGWIDLFVAREALVQGTQESAPCSLYRNLGDGRFEDVAPALGLDALGVVKGAAWGDIDNDGDLDLYVSRFGQENLLFVSQAGRGFVERAAEFGVSEPIVSFPTFFFDYDQDGWLDLFVGSFDNELSLDVLGPDFGSSIGQVAADHMGLPSTASQSRLFRNTGGGFEDVSAAAGVLQADLVMGANFGDLNADGFPDIYLGTGAPTFDALQPNVAWLNDGAGRFLDVTSSAGLGHLQKGHGIAFGDLDEDGDEDLLAMIGGAVRGDAFGSALFENPSDASGSLTLRLVGTLSNRSAIGARVRVVTDARVIHAVVGSGGSFGSSSLQVEVGLGAATRVERVEIDWPSGLSEVVDGVSGGEVVEIVEGAGVRSARARAPVLLDGESDHDHGEIAP